MLSWYRILWLREDRWRDDFATNYRIEEKSDKEIISKTIFLPKGYWWDSFEAKVDLHGGSITFSILDGSGKEIISDIEGRSFTREERYLTSGDQGVDRHLLERRYKTDHNRSIHDLSGYR